MVHVRSRAPYAIGGKHQFFSNFLLLPAQRVLHIVECCWSGGRVQRNDLRDEIASFSLVRASDEDKGRMNVRINYRLEINLQTLRQNGVVAVMHFQK